MEFSLFKHLVKTLGCIEATSKTFMYTLEVPSWPNSSYACQLWSFAIEKLLLSLSSSYYRKTLYQDVCDYVQNCEICSKSKPNFCSKSVPLHPLSVPSGPAQVWSFDHKNLCHKTVTGSLAVRPHASLATHICYLCSIAGA